MENQYIYGFFQWFVKKYSDEVYKKMGVFEIKEWAGGDPYKDLVMVINRQKDIIEIESNYFHGLKAEFDLLDIGILYEIHIQEAKK